MSDPYRSAPVRPCPACGQPLTSDQSSWLCDRGCGEWTSEPALRVVIGAEAVGAVLSFEGFKDPSAKCPDCRAELDGRIWGDAVFRICRRHGLWLETWARARFHKTVAPHAERRVAIDGDDEIAVRELAEVLRAQDPDRLWLARRMLALERRVQQLEQELSAGRGPRT